MTTQLRSTSSSELGQLKSCAQAYNYRYERNLVPKTFNKNMTIGTLYHQGEAAGYLALQKAMNAPGLVWDKDETFLTAAFQEVMRPDPRDRDGLSLGLDHDDVQATWDMVTYNWQHAGRFDEIDEILGVEEQIYFTCAGRRVRGTIDLRLRIKGQMEIWDHKTTGDISLDQTHLPLDLQTHLYYLLAWKMFGLAYRFVHSFQRRFDFGSDQRVGPPNWERTDGTRPYLLTKSGKAATRSDDPNDYVRRVPTPLSESQLVAFEKSLEERLMLLRYHELTDIWPRNDSKMGFGCGACPYYGICCSEADGREVAPAMLDMLFTKLPA
jgi:hypothetical protein